jgi:hypothetical protein
LRLSNYDRVQPDVQYLADSLAFQLIGWCIPIGLCFFVGVIRLLRLDWTTTLPFFGLGLAIAAALPAGLYRFLVRRAVRRFNARFPEGDRDRPAAVDVLSGTKSPFRAAQAIWLALARVPGGREAIPSRRSPTAFPAAPKVRPSSSQAPARGQVVILETRGRRCLVEPTHLSSGKSAMLVQRSPDCIEFVPSPLTWLFGLLSIVFGVSVLVGMVLSIVIHPEHWGLFPIIGIIFPVGFTTGGLWVLTSRARVERRAGEVRLASFFRERLACRFGDILAVQVVVDIVQGRQGSSPVYQVNLVLGDPARPRLNLVSKDDLYGRGAKDLLCCGRRLAAFLGVPLVDQAEAKAVFVPPESIGEASSQPVAGSHPGEKPPEPLEKPIEDKGPPPVESIREVGAAPDPRTSEELPEVVIRARAVPTLTVETRGRTCRVEPTTLQNVGLSSKEG